MPIDTPIPLDQEEYYLQLLINELTAEVDRQLLSAHAMWHALVKMRRGLWKRSRTDEGRAYRTS